MATFAGPDGEITTAALLRELRRLEQQVARLGAATDLLLAHLDADPDALANAAAARRRDAMRRHPAGSRRTGGAL